MMASSLGAGLTYHLTQLSIGLKKKGHCVTVISGTGEQVVGLSDALARAGIRHFKSHNMDKMALHSIYLSKNDIRKILKLRDVDVIHAQGTVDSLEAYLAAKHSHPDKRPSVVTSIHSVPRDRLFKETKWAVMTTLLNHTSDVVLPVSDSTRKLLIRHGLASEKVMVLHNALDLDVFDTASKEAQIPFVRDHQMPTIVNVANMTTVKGIEYYLVAAARILKNKKAIFYVIGDGPRREYLMELTCRLGIDKNVIFLGRIHWPGIYYFLSNVPDICVSSSTSENFPFYILECMAARKPIVATDVGGVSEAVVDKVTGYLVPPMDPESLAKAIIALIENPERGRQMGLEGRKIVEQRFNMKALTEKLTAVYERSRPTDLWDKHNS